MQLPDGVTRERALALSGVAGLMIVLLACLVMVAGALSDDEEPLSAAPTPAPTRTPAPTPTPKPKPTPVPLTPSQRAAREAAAEVVRSRGFEVVRLRDYDPRRKLRVLIGEDAAGMRMAFFFVDDSYIGNDSTQSSAELKVKRAGNVQVTLRYGLASGEDVDVRFKWNGSSLVPQDPVPDAAARAAGG